MIVVVISDCHLSWYRKIHSRYTYVCLWKTKNIHRTIILNTGNFLKKYSILTSKPMATSHLLDLNTTCMWVMSANLTQAGRCVPDSIKMLIQLDSHLYLFHWGQLSYSIWTCRCIHSISFEYHFCYLHEIQQCIVSWGVGWGMQKTRIGVFLCLFFCVACFSPFEPFK